MFSFSFLDQKMEEKLDIFLGFLEHFLDKKILRCLQCSQCVRSGNQAAVLICSWSNNLSVTVSLQR